MKKPLVLSYSGGKDSSFALYTLQNSPSLSAEWEVKRLLTTANSAYDRSSMHGVRRKLIEEQAASIDLPLDIVWLTPEDGGEGYKEKMNARLENYKAAGLNTIAFGDLYLEDIRSYREKMNASAGLESLFPIWGIPTKQLAKTFIEKGFKAIVVCVDTTQLDASFCGRLFDHAFLEDLPEEVDWCAEKGEFHTFCYDGPIFNKPVSFELGESVLRDGRFRYFDLLPIGNSVQGRDVTDQL